MATGEPERSSDDRRPGNWQGQRDAEELEALPPPPFGLTKIYEHHTVLAEFDDSVEARAKAYQLAAGQIANED